MVAERGNETIRSTRASALIAVAKAKIFAEEGWKTHITDEHGRNFEPAEFHLLPAMRVGRVFAGEPLAGHTFDD